MELIDFSSLFIQAVNVAIIIFVLWKFFFSPYLKFLDEEAKKRAGLEEQLKTSENVVKNAHAQADNIVDQAKVDAKIVATEIIENARKEAVEITTKAHTDADAARSK
jgi:F0F1-type ATP synthase membrane subunit b/b'